MSALRVDVAASPGAAESSEVDLIVVVEPLYGVPAVALALDAGWGSVEIAPLADAAAAPIPLISFEQSPPADQQGARCRARANELFRLLGDLRGVQCPVLLGAPVVARPLCAALAAADAGTQTIRFVPAPVGDELVALDAWWACGMLLRVLLDELADTGRDVELTDAAGLAVTVAQGAEPAGQQLAAGRRWREHLAAGGHQDDLRIAASVDSVGMVPMVVWESDVPVAQPWRSAG